MRWLSWGSVLLILFILVVVATLLYRRIRRREYVEFVNGTGQHGRIRR